MNNPWLMLTVSMITDVVATLLLKQVQGLKTPLTLLGAFTGYVASWIFFAFSIRAIPVGPAFAVWSAGGMILIVLLAILFYREVPDLPAIAGMSLIILGVALISMFSKMEVH